MDTTSDSTTDAITRHPEFYKDDADCVLLVENILFKVTFPLISCVSSLHETRCIVTYSLEKNLASKVYSLYLKEKTNSKGLPTSIPLFSPEIALCNLHIFSGLVMLCKISQGFESQFRS